MHNRIETLHAQNIINGETCDDLHWLRDLRNRAAHEWNFEITDDDLEGLPSKFKKTDCFFMKVVNVITHMWAAHVDVFGPIVMNDDHQ